jgi:hypothetical protein
VSGRTANPDLRRRSTSRSDTTRASGPTTGGDGVPSVVDVRNLTFAVLILLTAATMTNFGAIAGETVMLYPNVFHDPPDSLVLTREFLVAGGPSDFFPPLGAAVMASGAAAILLTWRRRDVRWWMVTAGAVYVCCELLFSVWFFWPRNEIMFVDPVGTHSAEYLRQVAAEFEAGHWVRLIGAGASAALAATGFLTWYRGALGAPARPVEHARAA